MSCSDLFQVDATLVANEFLDKYMPQANGDYVKVYLYLLRNGKDGVDIETAAESLELTEGDVRRAIKYWEKCGIVTLGGDTGRKSSGSARRSPVIKEEPDTAVRKSDDSEMYSEAVGDKKSDTADSGSIDADGAIRNRYKRVEGRNALNRLAEDLEYKQLLFMVQRYRSKILTEQDEQVLAYLYDGLKLPADVLDYLVQYCVETKHSSMRYIEKTGLDWASLGIRTVNDAKRRTRQFEKLKTGSAAKTTDSKLKNGISGSDEDLDSWLNEYAQRNIR